MKKIPEARSSHESIKRGINLLHNGDPSGALVCFEQALGFQKANPDGYYFMARAFIDLKNLKAARETIDLAKQRLPQIFTDNDIFGVYPRLELSQPGSPQILIRNHSSILQGNDGLVIESHAALELGIDLLDQTKFAAAITPLTEALKINAWNVHAYYYLGQAFANSGETAKAIAVFENAISEFPFTFKQTSRFGEYQGLEIDSKTVIAYYTALSKFIPDITAFLSPCLKTGLSYKKLKPPLEHKLELLFTDAIEKWRKNKIPLPPLSHNFLIKKQSENIAQHDTSVMLVTPRYIKCSPDWDEYEVSYYLSGTGKLALQNFNLHYADGFHTENYQLDSPRSDATLGFAISEFREKISEVRPEIVLFEGSFMGGLQCISREELHALKTEFKFKLATLVIDINSPLPNYAAYWSQISDLIIAMNENAYLDEARKNCPVIVYPGIPIDLDLFDRFKPPMRDLDALFIGARKRYRDMWCAYMIEGGIPLHMKFTVQSIQDSIRAHEFIEMHKRSRIIFNNGLISSKDHGLNLRIFEAITSGAVLLQQDFDQMHDYFVPYVHYAPFNNVHEMISTAQFLLKHNEIAENISSAAMDWYKQRYSGKLFWYKIINILRKI